VSWGSDQTIGWGGAPLPTGEGDMELIFFDEVTSGTQSAFTISNIPQTFKSLLIKTKFRTDENTNQSQVLVAFNADSSDSNYENRRSILGAAYSGTGLVNRNITDAAGNSSSSLQYRYIASTVAIVGYAGTLSHTSWHTHGDRVIYVASNQDYNASFSFPGVWKDTSAVTSMVLSVATGAFVAGSQVSVYGLR
jgi:hypothetical protein